jgi:hypothetical protein
LHNLDNRRQNAEDNFQAKKIFDSVSKQEGYLRGIKWPQHDGLSIVATN